MYGWDMRLICENGFYKFYPDYIGEVMLWENRNGIKLYNKGDFFTFKDLKDFPNYSLKGQIIVGENNALVNYTGRPEDVMFKNKLTFNLKTATITRADAIIQNLDYVSGAYLTFPKLPQAFALDEDLQPITGFSGFADVKMGTYKVERLFYENI